MDLEAQVLARETHLFSALKALAANYPAVYAEPRGMGLLVALPVRVEYEAAVLVAAARARGVLFGTAGGNSIRIAPPLVITDEQLDAAIAILGEVAKGLN